MKLPGWAVLEAAKAHYQQQADAVLHTPSLDEKTRFRAAVEWAALESFFRELRMRVREGQQASAALQKVQPSPSGV